MSGIIGQKLQQKIQANQLQQYGEVTGVILAYDKFSNTATIRYPNPHGGGYLYRDHAHVSSALGGITSDAIMPGQKCTIVFIDNNLMSPSVTGIIDSLYDKKTNTDQGAYLVDRTVLTVEKQEGAPLADTWFDISNDNRAKYSTQYRDYMQIDAAQEVYNIISGLDKYKSGESGITNLDQKTNIKHTENGDIEIFVANTVGVRISTTDHKIYFYGKGIYLNDQELTYKEAPGVVTEQPEENVVTEDDAIYKTFEGNIDLIDADVEELKRCIAYLKEITGMVDRYRPLESKITKYEKIRDSYEKGVTQVAIVMAMNDEIMALQPVFATELSEAQQVMSANTALAQQEV
jgi:hypothetical protein